MVNGYFADGPNLRCTVASSNNYSLTTRGQVQQLSRLTNLAAVLSRPTDARRRIRLARFVKPSRALIQLRTGSMRVIFLRHGETDSNVEGRMQGQYDTALNARGEDQARTVGRVLRQQERIDAVYSSDLKRAFRTAEIVADGQWSVIPEPKLRERFMGKMQNLLRVDAQKIAEREGKRLLDYGESSKELTARLVEGYLEVLADAETKGYRTILLVSHGSALTHLFKQLASDPDYKVSTELVETIRGPSKIGNCSVTIIDDNEFVRYAEQLTASRAGNVDEV